MRLIAEAKEVLFKDIIPQRYVDAVGPLLGAVGMAFLAWIGLNSNESTAYLAAATSAALLMSVLAIISEYVWGYALKATIYVAIGLVCLLSRQIIFAAFMGISAWEGWSAYVARTRRP